MFLCEPKANLGRGSVGGQQVMKEGTQSRSRRCLQQACGHRSLTQQQRGALVDGCRSTLSNALVLSVCYCWECRVSAFRLSNDRTSSSLPYHTRRSETLSQPGFSWLRHRLWSSLCSSCRLPSCSRLLSRIIVPTTRSTTLRCWVARACGASVSGSRRRARAHRLPAAPASRSTTLPLAALTLQASQGQSSSDPPCHLTAG